MADFYLERMSKIVELKNKVYEVIQSYNLEHKSSPVSFNDTQNSLVDIRDSSGLISILKFDVVSRIEVRREHPLVKKLLKFDFYPVNYSISN